MKIGVTGSEHICDRIQQTLEKRTPNLEVIYRRSDNYQYGLEAALEFQEMKLNGIIFTGPTNYLYALNRLYSAQPHFHLKGACRILCPLCLRPGCDQHRHV